MSSGELSGASLRAGAWIAGFVLLALTGVTYAGSSAVRVWLELTAGDDAGGIRWSYIGLWGGVAAAGVVLPVITVRLYAAGRRRAAAWAMVLSLLAGFAQGLVVTSIFLVMFVIGVTTGATPY